MATDVTPDGYGLRPARLSWEPDGTPRSETFEDVYFSRRNGLAESEYVFLRHNDFPARFAQAKRLTIAETGFGTGLNFLLACESWRQCAPTDAQLHFISFEKHPLQLDDLKKAHAAWPTLSRWADRLQARWPPLTPGWHCLPVHPRIKLWIWFGDVHDGIGTLAAKVDAWYLDGFAPARNPDMWTEALFDAMASLSAPGATFATFTSAGRVRRGLQAAGFIVRKAPGHGRKREMCHGYLPGEWRPALAPTPRSVAIIGAGLAGASAARLMAEQGMNVVVLEAERPACGASGNRAGVFHPVATADWSLRSQWYQLGLEMASPYLLHAMEEGVSGRFAPVLHLPPDEKWLTRLQSVRQRYGDPALIRPHPAPPCAPNSRAAFAYGWSGWIAPAQWTRWLLNHPSIEVRTHRVRTVRLRDAHVAVDDTVYEMAIWAGGVGTLRNAPWPEDWIRPVKGQVSFLADPALARKAPAPLIYRGYTVPTDTGLVLGATFEKRGLEDLTPHPAARAHNIDCLRTACPRLAQSLRQADEANWSERVALRPATRDHTPIAGWLRMGRLGVSLGHGARGLISTLLAGYILARDLLEDQRNGPAFAPLWRLSDPNRFDHKTKKRQYKK